MTIRKPILTAAAAGVLLGFSGMAMASQTQKSSSSASTKQALPKTKSKSTGGVSRGTITSIDNDRLVFSHKGKNGKPEELTFMLNYKTEKKGNLATGSQVSVHYRARTTN